MKRLCLLRHAKAVTGEPGGDDFHRALNEKGQRAAEFMGEYIFKSPYRPDAVLCSTATRAVETFAPLAARLGAETPILYRDQLYHAMPDVMLDEIHSRAPASATTLLMVGHNPGLVLLGMSLANDPEDEIALRVANGVPTGGFIVFEFDAKSWREIANGKGRTVFFGRPRDLMGKN
jgi:phosphohistidine phosphatase